MNLTLSCCECEHDVEVQDGVEKVVCINCHATLTVAFDADLVNGTWMDCSHTYLATPEETR